MYSNSLQNLGSSHLVWRHLRAAMGGDEVLLLSFLEHHAGILARNEDWFCCTADHIMTEFSCSKQQQQRWMKNLREARFVDTEMRGTPPCRHIRINHDRIEEAVQTCRNAWTKEHGKRITIYCQVKENLS